MSPPPPPPDAPLPLPPLPPEILVEILCRVHDAVSLVRCAATCKGWRRLIQEPSFLPSLHRRLEPCSLLGLFFRDTSQRLPRRRLYRRRPTRFLLLGASQPSSPVVLPMSRFFDRARRLDGFAPVASGPGGLVALCRLQAGICVCNPLAGTSTFLPPLPSHFVPEKVVFLGAGGGSSFCLLAVMAGQQGGLVLRVFPSETGDWDAPVTAELPDNMVVLVDSPATVHRDAVHWVCGTHALPHAVQAVAVRLTQAGASVSRIDLPALASVHRLPGASRVVRLASEPQGTLSSIILDGLTLTIWNLEDRKEWSLYKAVNLVPMMKSLIHSCRDVKLSIAGLCETSGSLFLRFAGEGLFVFDLETEKLLKVCKDNCTTYLCPYVTDFDSCLAAMKRF